jgi:hypothetical protein
MIDTVLVAALLHPSMEHREAVVVVAAVFRLVGSDPAGPIPHLVELLLLPCKCRLCERR